MKTQTSQRQISNFIHNIRQKGGNKRSTISKDGQGKTANERSQKAEMTNKRKGILKHLGSEAFPQKRHKVHEEDCSEAAAFSFIAGFARMTASWPVILRPRARSTLAPRASLLRLSVFSVLGINRCFVRGLFSKRSRPSRRLLYSVTLGSPLGRLPVVRSEAIEGLPLTVENLFEARFYTVLDSVIADT